MMIIRYLLTLALLLTCIAWMPRDLFVIIQHQLLLRVVDSQGDPQAGVIIRWRNEWHQTITDANGEARLTVAPQSDTWDTLVVLDAKSLAVTAQGAGLSANMDGGWVRFRIASNADYRVGPLTIVIQYDTLPTETPKPTATVGPSATPGPSASPTIQEPPTPDWPPVPHPPATLDPNERLPWDLLRLIEQRSYEEEHTNPPDLLAVQDTDIYLAALTHSGTKALWAQGYDAEGCANWRVPADRMETGIFWVEYGADRVECLAFANMIVAKVESSGRIFILQHGGFLLAEVVPGTAWEVPQ